MAETTFCTKNDDEKLNQVLQRIRTGRPAGSDAFITSLENLTEWILHPLHRLAKKR